MKTQLDPGLRKVAEALYVYLNTPVALKALILLREQEWDQLASMAVDPRNYLDATSTIQRLRKDMQACDFLRKSPDLPVSVDRRKGAVDAFWCSEKQCLETNLSLGLLHFPSVRDAPDRNALRSILLRAAKIVKRILGPVPDSLSGRFGPGTSFELKGQPYSTVADKVWVTPHSTPQALALFEHFYWPTSWGRERLREGLPLPRVVRGNRFTTVPKTSLTDRGICVEPLGNLYLQLGVGSYMKGRLRQVGLEVDKSISTTDPFNLLELRHRPLDGQTIHRVKAREGSTDGRWATIDLSNASDTVALELVRWLLPPEWFDLLCALRSPFTFLDGAWVHLSKFSSMGNGFTFELETLIFAALSCAVADLVPGRNCWVYGDDIIVPREKAQEVLAVLRATGFTPNPRKCFTTHLFRESCGGDYFMGEDVRPVYVTKRITSPVEWISLHNRLRRKWGGARVALGRCVEQLPSNLRCFGPPRLGDGVLHGPYTPKWRNGIAWLATVRPVPKRISLDRWGEGLTLTMALLGVPSSGVVPRDSVTGYRKVLASVS